MNIHSMIADMLNVNDYGAITLGELIDTLASADQSLVVNDGFGKPDSWRGVYAFLAFRPATDTVVADMLKNAQSAVGTTFQGYKGGEFTMTRESPVFIAPYGESDADNAAITVERLQKMLGVCVAEKRESKMPVRPKIADVHISRDGDWGVFIPSDRWDDFKAYVCELEGIVAKLDS